MSADRFKVFEGLDLERMRRETELLRAQIDLAKARAELASLNSNFLQRWWSENRAPLTIVIGALSTWILFYLGVFACYKLWRWLPIH